MTRGLGRPIARMGQPEGIAEAVVFLTSPASHYITGQALSNTSNSDAENWTRIGVVVGFWAVVLLRYKPHTRNVDTSENI